jgi:phospholipase A2
MLHPERNVDVILNMDASSDVQKDSFQQRVSQIGYRRGLDFKKRRDIKAGTDTADPDRFKGLYAQIYDGAMVERPEKVVDSNGVTVKNPPAASSRRECTMVYLPLLPNERAVPGYDPSTAKFSGSYNLVWTPEQVDMIIKTSMANFNDGQVAIKEALFNAWQRNKYLREQGYPKTTRGPAPTMPTQGTPTPAAPTPAAPTPATSAAGAPGQQAQPYFPPPPTAPMK